MQLQLDDKIREGLSLFVLCLMFIEMNQVVKNQRNVPMKQMDGVPKLALLVTTSGRDWTAKDSRIQTMKANALDLTLQATGQYQSETSPPPQNYHCNFIIQLTDRDVCVCVFWFWFS